jgi:hypothetical protein
MDTDRFLCGALQSDGDAPCATRLVATIGPATHSVDVLEKLLKHSMRVRANANICSTQTVTRCPRRDVQSSAGWGCGIARRPLRIKSAEAIDPVQDLKSAEAANAGII